MDNLKLGVEWEIDGASLKEGMGAARREIESAEKSIQNSAKQMENLNSQVEKLTFLAAGVFQADKAKDFISKMISVRSELKDVETSFKVFLGSSERAEVFMSKLSQHAYNSIFEFKDISIGAANLLSYGAAAGDVVAIMSQLSNIAAGTNQPLTNMIDLYNKAATSTKLMKQDLEQMQRNGIPIVRQLAEAYNKTQQEIWDMASAGKIGFKDMQVALDGLTGIGGMFFNMMEEKSKNLSDRIGLLQDSMTNMYNELGAENEGVLRSGIDLAIKLVENYQEIIKALKLLVATYGIYRTSLIANTVAMSGMTVLELLHYSRLVIIEKAQKLLNVTTAANPYVAAAAALAILGSALYLFADRSTNAEKAQAKLNDVIQESSMRVVEETVKLNDLVRIAKDETKSKSDRIKAINSINQIAPEYLGNLTLENVKTKEGTDLLNKYVEALKKKAFEEAAYAERVSIEKEKLALNSGDAVPWYAKPITGLLDYINYDGDSKSIKENYKKEAKELLDAREEAINSEIASRVTDSSNKSDNNSAALRNKQFYQAIIDENTSKLNNLDRTSTDFVSKSAPLKKAIADAQNALSAYEIGDSVKDAKTYSTMQSKMVDDKATALKKVADLEIEYARNSKMSAAQEVQALEDKYANIIEILDEANKKIKEHNKKNPLYKVSLIDNSIVDPIKEKEVAALKYKQETDALSKEIEEQKKIFEAYENYKSKLGKSAADEKFKTDLKGFENYAQYLDSVISKESEAFTAVNNKTANAGQEARVKGLKKESEEANKVVKQQQIDILTLLITYDQQRKNMLERQAEERKQIESTATAEGLAEMDRRHREEVNKLDDTNIEKLAEVKHLFEGIDRMTDAGARSLIDKINKLLSSNADISPELREKIKKSLKEVTESLNDRLPERTLQIADGFSQMAQSLGTVNEGLSSMLGGLSNVLRATVQVSKGIDGLSKGLKNYQAYQKTKNEGGGSLLGSLGAIAGVAGPVGQIVGAVSSVVGGVVNFFKSSKESARKAAQEIKAYQESVLIGEYEYNRVLRERAREQQNINDLTNEQLKLQQQLVKLQSTESKSDYDDLLKRIGQEGQQITSKKTEKYGGFLGIGKKTRVVDVTAGLAGYTYEQLEELNASNKLTESTKKLFEELKKAKEELEKINKEGASIQKELLDRMSGNATSSAISNSIINGFKQGRRAVVDFADDAEEIIQNALLSAMNYTVLDAPLQELIKKFREDAADGLSEKEIEEFKKGYNNIVEKGLEAIKEIEKATGRSIGGNSKSTLSSGIERITEQSATEWIAISRVGLDISKRNEIISQKALDIWQSSYSALVVMIKHNAAIEQNTADTVEQLKLVVGELKTTNKNLQGGSKYVG